MSEQLRNFQAYQDAKVYTFRTLNEWLPSRLRPTDIDAALERNDCFLWFEFKGKHCELPTGQRRFWEALLRQLRGRGHLLIVEHEPANQQTVVDPMLEASVVRMMWFDRDEERTKVTGRVRAERGTMEWIFRAWEEATRGDGKPLNNWCAAFASDN